MKLFTDKNKDLSLVDPLTQDFERVIDIIVSLPGCRFVTALPDAGMSNHETPYGVATICQEYIIPQLLGRVISCGMGLINIDIDPVEIGKNSDEIIKIIGLYINENKSRFHIGNNLLDEIYRIGPSAILKIIPGLRDRTDHLLWESVNLSPFLKDLREIEEIIPPWILNDKNIFHLPGQSIRKNHFVEFSSPLNQDKVQNQFEVAGKTFCSFHMESPLTFNINSAYAGTRKKDRMRGALKETQTWVGLLHKARFHLGVEGVRNFSRVRKCFLSHKEFTPVLIDSLSGQRYLSALKLQINYERTARHIFSFILMEALEKAIGRTLEWKIVFESNHSTFEADTIDGENVLISRKNLVKKNVSRIGYIAGMYNMPSIIFLPRMQRSGLRWLDSYDHGIGNQLWRDWDYEIFQNKRGSGEDLSQFEKILRQVSAHQGTIEDNRIKTVGECVAYRVNLCNNSFDKERHAVLYGRTIQHMLKVYGGADSPAQEVELLIPFLNYKET